MANLSPEDIAFLLDRVDEEMEDAKEELEHAQSIIQTAGLTVHSSVLNEFASSAAGGSGGGDAAASSAAAKGGDSATSTSTSTNNNNNVPPPSVPMDLQQEAALDVQARHKYNPMRGTLSAFPLVLTTTGCVIKYQSVLKIYELNCM